jgi:glycosyltransferase involved in cell wall biosynthesis
VTGGHAVAGWADPGSGNGRALRVATVITRLEGGAGVLALRGACALARHGCHVTIITGSAGRLAEEAAAAGVEVIVEPALRAPLAPGSDLRALKRLEGLLRSRTFDVVHTHCAKAGVVGRLAARRAGVSRIVHTYHGFPFHEFQSRPRRQAYLAIERRLGRITDVALCVGAGVAAEAVRRELAAPDRIVTIGVAVDGPERARAVAGAGSPLARQRARISLGIPAQAAVVGAVGRLTYQKAPEDFLAALQLLDRPGAIGVWVGSGECAEQIARRARGLRGIRLILAGERGDVLEILPAFDIFALPSRYEGLPTAVVEAMLCGVPVIATAVNAVPDLVVPGETGLLVPPRRPAALAAAVRYLLDFPAIADRLAATALARVGGRYRESELLDALLAAYLPGRQALAVPSTSAQ